MDNQGITAQTPTAQTPTRPPNTGYQPTRLAPSPRPPHIGAEQIARDERMIYVGKKELMSYVLAVVTQFNNNLPEVHIKARGKMISRAVDIAEIVRHRFMPDVKIKNISISTEELPSEDGRMSKVSSIEIALSR
jgi:DNA-binding protein